MIQTAEAVNVQVGELFNRLQTRIIYTRANGTAPSVYNYGVIRGAWFVGTSKPPTETHVVQCQDNAVFDSCVFAGYYGGINIAGGRNVAVRNCAFINCGTDELWHPTYVNNGDAQQGEGTLMERNLVIGGQGYALHLWHDPAWNTVRNNFVAGNRALAQQGAHNVWSKNVIWANGKYPCAYIDNGDALRFERNFFGQMTTPHILNLPANATIDRNAFVNGVRMFGTNARAIAKADIVKFLGYTPARINAAVTYLKAAFAQDLQNIEANTAIADEMNVLFGALDAWACRG